MKLKLAMAQINTVLGDVPKNLQKHLELIEEARGKGADLVTFPELSLTGYALQDLATTVACKPLKTDATFAPLLEASRNIDIIVGFVEEDKRNRFYIASAYLSEGKVLHVHHKVYLPTYGLFDEGRFFAWGDTIRAFDTRFGRVGMLICEDFWHASLPYLLWLDGADLFFFASASPGRGLPHAEGMAHLRAWIPRAGWMTSTALMPVCLPPLWSTPTGWGLRTVLNFWGGASVYNPDGEALVQGPQHEEASGAG